MKTLGDLVLAQNLFHWMEDAFLRLNFRERGTSTFAAESDLLFFWIFLISTFFFVLLMVLMVWFAFRYRRRPGVAPERSRSHNTFLELSWSVIPTIILVWMFFEGFWGYTSAVVAPAHAQELVVTGQKWSWQVMYPNGAGSPLTTRTREMGNAPEQGSGIQDTPIFVVPEKYPVSLRMSSTDVIHAFWVPDFRVKFDVFPNRYTNLWFEPLPIDPAKAGTATTKGGHAYTYEDHWVFCAEYCGSNHSEMYAIMRVVPMASYLAIIKEWAEPTGTIEEVGEALYKLKGCNACHLLDGTKYTGPSWKDIYGRPVKFTDGTSRSAEQMTGVEFANYIRESIYTPSVKVVETYPNQMQSYQGRINERELNALIAFMISISANKPPGLEQVIPTEILQQFEGAGVTPTPEPPEPGTPSNIPPQVPPAAPRPPNP